VLGRRSATTSTQRARSRCRPGRLRACNRDSRREPGNSCLVLAARRRGPRHHDRRGHRDPERMSAAGGVRREGRDAVRLCTPGSWSSGHGPSSPGRRARRARTDQAASPATLCRWRHVRGSRGRCARRREAGGPRGVAPWQQQPKRNRRSPRSPSRRRRVSGRSQTMDVQRAKATSGPGTRTAGPASADGKPRPRMEARSKVTGRAKSTYESSWPGMLYGRMIGPRSPPARSSRSTPRRPRPCRA